MLRTEVVLTRRDVRDEFRNSWRTMTVTEFVQPVCPGASNDAVVRRRSAVEELPRYFDDERVVRQFAVTGVDGVPEESISARLIAVVLAGSKPVICVGPVDLSRSSGQGSTQRRYK